MRAVLSFTYPDLNDVNTFSRTLQRFDKAGNRTDLQQSGSYAIGGGNYADTIFSTNHCTFDGLNRPATGTVRDGAATTNGWSAINTLTNQFLPGGLRRVAAFTTDGRMTQEYVIGSDTNRMGERSFGYFAAGTAFAGKPQSVSDTRGVVRTNSYDDWCILSVIGASGALPEQNSTTAFQHDRRGLQIQIAQSYADSATGPGTTIRRTFDAYRQLAYESVTIGTTAVYTAAATFDNAGRRVALDVSPLGAIHFAYRVDGLMTNVNALGYSVGYSYLDNGLMASRNDGTKSITYTHNNAGHLTGSVAKFGSTTNLAESFSLWPDGRLIQYVAQRSTFTDTRNYNYAAASLYLTNENYYLNSGLTENQDYHFDLDVAHGLGVLTGSGDWDAVASGGLDSLKRPLKGTTSYARVPAFGKAFGAASVSATLNGKAVPVDFTEGNSNGWFYAQLVPSAGTNTLQVSAVHPSGQFTNSATSSFTNNITAHVVTNLSDAFGNVLRKVWRGTNGVLVREQDFTWDAFDRLVKVSESDANTNGYIWRAVFDGFGRRIRVTEQYVLTNILSASTSVADSYYDPAVEFLEIGVKYNGRKELKVYGPDLSGTYGGVQGIGGLEAVIDAANMKTNTVLSDRFGSVLGYAAFGAPTSFSWSTARFNGYGTAVGYETPFLSSGVSLVQSLGWQGQRRDITGLYYWNARPYDAVERRFLALDPRGFADGPNAFGLCHGDPVNKIDEDGRQPVNIVARPLGPPLEFPIPSGLYLYHGPFAEYQGHLVNAQQAKALTELENEAIREYNRSGAIQMGDMDFVNAAGLASAFRLGLATVDAAAARTAQTLTATATADALRQEILGVATSPQFMTRAEAAGFTGGQISQLPARIEAYGGNISEGLTGGYSDAAQFSVGRFPLLSTREGIIRHELGHVLDDIANPGLFERAAEGELGFGGFYQAETVAYRMQYGFNPVPLTAFNAGMQSNPFLTSSILAGGTGAASYLLKDPLANLLAPIFSPAQEVTLSKH